MMRARTVWSGVAGAPYYSNHYFAVSATVVDAQACIDATHDFWDDMKGAIDNACLWDVQAEVAIIDPVSGNITGIQTAVGKAGAGTSATAAASQLCQGLVKWSTGVFFGGRELVGHTFIPGLPNDQLSPDGSLGSGYTSALTAAGTTFVNAPPELGVWSRKNGAFATATAASGVGMVASLRSRRD